MQKEGEMIMLLESIQTMWGWDCGNKQGLTKQDFLYKITL